MAKLEDASSLRKTKRHQRALAGGKRLEVWPAQIFRDEFVELVFAFFRREFFKQRQPVGVGNVGGDLPAQCAMTNRFQTRLESSEDLLLSQVGELLAKALRDRRRRARR